MSNETLELVRIADNVSKIDRQRTVEKTTKLLKTLIKLVFGLKIAPTKHKLSIRYPLDIQKNLQYLNSK